MVIIFTPMVSVHPQVMPKNKTLLQRLRTGPVLWGHFNSQDWSCFIYLRQRSSVIHAASSTAVEISVELLQLEQVYRFSDPLGPVPGIIGLFSWTEGRTSYAKLYKVLHIRKIHEFICCLT